MFSQTLPIFFSTMSSTTTATSSDHDDDLFLLTKDQQEDTDNNNSQTIAEIRLVPQSESTASNTSEIHSTAPQQEAEAEAESCEIRAAESKEVQELMIKLKPEDQKEGDNDDGFRTPTSLVHRIPEPKQCPAPPRKPKPSLKRKAHHSHHTTSFTSSSSFRRDPLDLSIEVELLLFQGQHNPLSADSHHQNPKKSRRH